MSTLQPTLQSYIAILGHYDDRANRSINGKIRIYQVWTCYKFGHARDEKLLFVPLDWHIGGGVAIFGKFGIIALVFRVQR